MNIKRMVTIRKENKISQRKLSEKINVAYTQIARYETGVNVPPIEYIEKFCNYFGVSADYILDLPKGLKYPDNEWYINNMNELLKMTVSHNTIYCV